MHPWRVCNQPIQLHCTRGPTLLQASPHPTHQGKRQLKPAWGWTWEGCNEWEHQWQRICCWDIICLTKCSLFSLPVMISTDPPCCCYLYNFRPYAYSKDGILSVSCWGVCAFIFAVFGVCCEIVDVQMDAKTYLILSMWYSDDYWCYVVNSCCVPLIFNKSWRSPPFFPYFSSCVIIDFSVCVTPYSWPSLIEHLQIPSTFNFKKWGTFQLFANMRINIAICKDTLIWFQHSNHILFWGGIYLRKSWQQQQNKKYPCQWPNGPVAVCLFLWCLVSGVESSYLGQKKKHPMTL